MLLRTRSIDSLATAISVTLSEVPMTSSKYLPSFRFSRGVLIRNDYWTRDIRLTLLGTVDCYSKSRALQMPRLICCDANCNIVFYFFFKIQEIINVGRFKKNLDSCYLIIIKLKALI